MNIFLSLVCALFLLASGWLGLHHYQLLKGSRAIRGVVVAIDRTSDRESGQRHMPIVEYVGLVLLLILLPLPQSSWMTYEILKLFRVFR
ncbi:MAG: hypothetical protein VKJ64_13820 [Leptolyngbyaceae bacterium]|nr:hypothetical protein [Leptolyngbyaceae bacterium]